MDGLRFDGREWKVDWASKKDFEFFDKEWFETEKARAASRSRSRSV
jgi:arginine/serine-rich splicing factor 2